MFLSKRNGTYYIFYNQENNKRTCKSTNCKTKSEALKYLGEFSKVINERKRNPIQEITLKDYRMEFLRFSETYHTNKTYLTYKGTFNFLLEYFGNISLSNITTRLLDEFIRWRINSVSLHAGRKDLINLKACLTKAIEFGYLENNPATKIKRIRIPEKLPLFFSRDEFEKLINTVDEKDWKDIIIFAVNSGMRMMEILTLKENQFIKDHKLIVLNNQEHITKSKKIRQLPLNETAYNILLYRKSNSEGLMFTLNGEKILQDHLVKKFKKFVIKSGVNPKLHFHSLRHSFASWLVQKDVPIYNISKLLGHADIKTTEIYAHLRNEDLRNAVDLI
jgi:integrase